VNVHGNIVNAREIVLSTEGLAAGYGGEDIISNLSVTVEKGGIFTIIGPNGSGKSTTVKILTGLLEPTRGEILWDGIDVRQDFVAYKRRIGYVPEEAHLYPHLSGREYLQLAGRLRGIEHQRLSAKTDELLRLFGLFEDRYSPLSSYSKGMRQKVLLSAALLHDPEMLILDEPFSGLDVSTAMILRSLLKALTASGKMILFSSHVLEVVEKVCSQVLILRKGRVVAHDSVDRLRELLSLASLEDVFQQLSEQENPDQAAAAILGVMKA